ncbi:MAG: hypothetical protein NVS1B13_11190 [Flavisolibacter sp.]
MAVAQNFHFATRLGLAGYQGDLKQSYKVLSQINLFGSLGAQYDISEHIAARTYLSYTKLRADDKKGSLSMQQRNLNFQTHLLEWELSAQYSLFSLNDKWWTPYVYGGVGIYHFNPYTTDINRNKVFLQPLGTEGQGIGLAPSAYKKTQFSLPIGFGINYSIDEDSRIGLEAGYRILFTDYLDDVSTNYADESTLRKARGQQAVDLAWRGYEVTGQPYPVAGMPRGSAAHRDGYYYIAITFTMRYWFDKYKEMAGIPSSRRDKKVGCPASRAPGF